MIFPTKIELLRVVLYAKDSKEVIDWYTRYFCYLNHLTH